MQPISAALNEEVYFEIVKRLYATASIKSEQLSFEAIRQMSSKPPGKQQKHPKFWMPPKSALIKVTKLINCQIKYLFTVWTHDAVLPNFLAEGCLKKDTTGSIQYDFGDEIQIKNIETTFTIQDDELKRLIDAASISRKREKKTKRVRSIESTPVKPEQIKKKPIMSTPIKMKLQKKDV
ncbi:uncharacterized protein LOC127736539 [Mytilus californianus]|uniref:uncharacterized protein LOC127736539 n=1 Tax=Mytilus californianus TaxID=6549 RepID=UPI0022468505|nr:uncharacterized protein LOC127736539 [Mytilus californianus]